MTETTAAPTGIARSDIDFLGAKLDGFDPLRYFDQQDEVEARAAARRWPLLAGLLGYAPPGPPADNDAGDARPQAGARNGAGGDR